jgi:hypothetical protein
MNNKKLLSFITGIVIGFVLFYVFGAGKEGGNPKMGFNTVLYVSDGKCIHIHHWVHAAIISLIITATVIFTCNFFTPVIIFVYGFLLGASLEDLRYKDFMKFKKKCRN